MAIIFAANVTDSVILYIRYLVVKAALGETRASARLDFFEYAHIASILFD